MYTMVINIKNGNYRWQTNWGLVIQAKRKEKNVEVEYEYDHSGIIRTHIFENWDYAIKSIMKCVNYEEIHPNNFEYNGLILEEIDED